MTHRRFLLPAKRALEPSGLVVSIAAHLLFFGLLSLTVTDHAGDSFRSFVQAVSPEPSIVSDEPFFIVLTPSGVGDEPGLGTGTGEVAEEPPAPVVAPPPEGVPAGIGRDSVIDPAPIGGGRTVAQALQPSLGSGVLWIATIVLDEERGQLIRALGELANLDSALAARIVAYLDTVPADSFAVGRLPQEWAIDIDGEKWGISQGWLHLGPLKLPTALLALIPGIGNVGGSWDQGQAAASLQRMRDDLMRAAERAQSMEQFRDYVNQTRQRNDDERQRRLERERQRDEEERARREGDLVP